MRVKEFRKLANICRRYGQLQSGTFFLRYSAETVPPFILSCVIAEILHTKHSARLVTIENAVITILERWGAN